MGASTSFLYTTPGPDASVPLVWLLSPSKIRIQEPGEKVFVMLQAAIGQHYFQDGGLRQQMTNMIDGASQILSAVEQVSNAEL